MGSSEPAAAELAPTPAAPAPEPVVPELEAAPLESLPVPGKLVGAENLPSWRLELSERVENFRRRRARMRQGLDPNANRSFDFQAADEETEVGGRVIEFPQAEGNVELALAIPLEPQTETPAAEAPTLEKTGGGMRVLTSAAVEAGEIPLEHPTPKAEPVEIVLESPTPQPELPSAEALPTALPVASLGRRFLAGMADAVVLAAAAGVFAFIFTHAGGHVSLLPLNVAVVVFIAVALFMVYFGLFTALTSSTPGLLWMGLEVRNLDGDPPAKRESFWRAFGYLVSTAALLLGFIWALVDSDGLTWHDRMSGTFIAPAQTRNA